MTERSKCGRCDRPTTDALCAGCVRHAQRVLADIRGLFADLGDTVARRGRGAHLADVRTRGLKATPLPFVEGPRITQAREELDVLGHWATYATGQPVHTVIGAVNVLARSDSWFRIDPEAKRCIDVLHAVRNTLRAAVDRPPTVVYLGRCGAPVIAGMLSVGADGDDGATITVEAVDTVCDSTLGEVLGDNSIKCRACGKIHTPGSRNSTAIAAMYGAVLPLDVILDALPHLIGHRPKARTVRSWRQRGQLRPVVNLTRNGGLYRTDESGNLLYLADDVLALVRDTHARPGPRRKDVPA